MEREFGSNSRGKKGGNPAYNNGSTPAEDAASELKVSDPTVEGVTLNHTLPSDQIISGSSGINPISRGSEKDEFNSGVGHTLFGITQGGMKELKSRANRENPRMGVRF